MAPLAPHRGLLTESTAALARRMADGHPIEPGALAGFGYRGVSIGPPAWLNRFVLKFMKCFVSDADGTVRGWNQRMRQDGLGRPWTPLRVAGRPVVYGHYDVVPAIAHPTSRVYPQSLVLDYRRGEPWHGPLRVMGDYLVALTPGDPTALLGHMFLGLGRWEPLTPSFFLLLRGDPIQDVVPRRTPGRVSARAATA